MISKKIIKCFPSWESFGGCFETISFAIKLKKNKYEIKFILPYTTAKSSFLPKYDSYKLLDYFKFDNKKITLNNDIFFSIFITIFLLLKKTFVINKLIPNFNFGISNNYSIDKLYLKKIDKKINLNKIFETKFKSKLSSKGQIRFNQIKKIYNLPSNYCCFGFRNDSFWKKNRPSEYLLQSKKKLNPNTNINFHFANKFIKYVAKQKNIIRMSSIADKPINQNKKIFDLSKNYLNFSDQAILSSKSDFWITSSGGIQQSANFFNKDSFIFNSKEFCLSACAESTFSFVNFANIYDYKKKRTLKLSEIYTLIGDNLDFNPPFLNNFYKIINTSIDQVIHDYNEFLEARLNKNKIKTPLQKEFNKYRKNCLNKRLLLMNKYSKNFFWCTKEHIQKYLNNEIITSNNYLDKYF